MPAARGVALGADGAPMSWENQYWAVLKWKLLVLCPGEVSKVDIISWVSREPGQLGWQHRFHVPVPYLLASSPLRPSDLFGVRNEAQVKPPECQGNGKANK